MAYAPENPDGLYPDAWCDECDKVLDDEGEWNEKSQAFADIKVICCQCYEAIRERNMVVTRAKWVNKSKLVKLSGL